jgi:signal transduction histidine kinase
VDLVAAQGEPTQMPISERQGHGHGGIAIRDHGKSNGAVHTAPTLHREDTPGLASAPGLAQDAGALRPVHRQILASLTFLVPLGLLAWLGAEELRREGERAAGAVTAHAVGFLSLAAEEIGLFVDRSVGAVLSEAELDLVETHPLVALEELSDPESPGAGLGLRDIFLLDRDGQLLFPHPPPTDLGLPLNDSPGINRGRGPDAPDTRELYAAEILEARGELQEARVILERFLSRGPRFELWEQEAWARLLLAAISRQQGDLEEAASRYQVVVEEMDVIWFEIESRGEPMDPKVVSVRLLADVGLAEVEDDAEHRWSLMDDISYGVYDHMADEMLGAIMDRLLEGIPPDQVDLYRAALDAQRTNAYRVEGRRFAANYELYLAETLRLRLSRPTEEPVFYKVFTDDDGSWLLALRRATQAERTQHGCEWVGVRLDLVDLLLNEVMDPFLVTNADGFTLAILDSDGLPVMPSEALPAEVELSSETTHGMQLRAIRGNPDSFLAADQASLRNRALLIVFLVLVAGGGAIFLWRSVARESELAQLKVDLVSRVSHELKTPLALIRLYGDTLAMGRTKDQEQVTHFAGVITRESERLGNMIGRILDFSRQQAGTLHYEKQAVEVGGLVASVIDAYRPHVEARGASLALDLAEELVVEVDPDALEAAVLNLLENAVKYTPGDAPDRAIQMALHRDNGRAILEVSDRGVGVPAAERERVFDSFYRASNASEVRGAGLGLSLVHHFAEAHGGTIEILARSGGGTTVRLALPMAQSRESDGKTT